MKKSLLGLLLVASVAWAGSSPVPQSVRVHPYKPKAANGLGAGGKYIQVCFDRVLARRESYGYQIDIRTRAGQTVTGRGTLGDTFGETPSACVSYNVFLMKRRITDVNGPAAKAEAEAWNAVIENDIRPGNVEVVTYRIYSSPGSKGVLSTTHLRPEG